MKKLLVLAALAAIFTIPALAQNADKDELFSKIVKLSQDKKPEKKAEAYKLSKDYLAKFGKDTDEKTKKVAEFATNYRINEFNTALDKGNYDDAFEMGKEMLEANPEDSYITMSLAYAGYDALVKKNDKGYADASINYGKKTIELFEAGKLPKTFVPFKTKDEATAMMYYSMANLQLDFDAAEAMNSLYKALKFESQIKNDAYTYYLVAKFYEDQYQERAKEFQEKHAKKQAEDAEMKKDNERLQKILDMMIDAYARTVKLAADTNPNKQGWIDRLAAVYKFRKGSDAGLTDYTANILSTPLAEPKAL